MIEVSKMDIVKAFIEAWAVIVGGISSNILFVGICIAIIFEVGHLIKKATHKHDTGRQ